MHLHHLLGISWVGYQVIAAQAASTFTRRAQHVFPPTTGPCPQNAGNLPCMWFTSETALLDLNLTRCEQTLVPRSHVLISQLKVYAIFKRNKDFQFVDAARRKKMSLVRHVEETLVAEYAMALV